jgi:hypothetical protein
VPNACGRDWKGHYALNGRLHAAKKQDLLSTRLVLLREGKFHRSWEAWNARTSVRKQREVSPAYHC